MTKTALTWAGALEQWPLDTRALARRTHALAAIAAVADYQEQAYADGRGDADALLNWLRQCQPEDADLRLRIDDGPAPRIALDDLDFLRAGPSSIALVYIEAPDLLLVVASRGRGYTRTLRLKPKPIWHVLGEPDVPRWQLGSARSPARAVVAAHSVARPGGRPAAADALALAAAEASIRKALPGLAAAAVNVDWSGGLEDLAERVHARMQAGDSLAALQDACARLAASSREFELPGEPAVRLDPFLDRLHALCASSQSAYEVARWFPGSSELARRFAARASGSPRAAKARLRAEVLTRLASAHLPGAHMAAPPCDGSIGLQPMWPWLAARLAEANISPSLIRAALEALDAAVLHFDHEDQRNDCNEAWMDALVAAWQQSQRTLLPLRDLLPAAGARISDAVDRSEDRRRQEWSGY